MAAAAAGAGGDSHAAARHGEVGLSSMAHPLSLRQLTRGALEHTFLAAGGAREGQQEWTVLVIDPFARDVIAPIMRVGDLRRLGITLFLPLAGKRQPIPDAPAVYLCKPTEEAVRRIAEDCCQELYRSFSINFLSPIPRKLLELLAELLQSRQSLAHIKVKDQFLSFVSPECDLFSLQISDSYYMCASHTVTQHHAEAFLEEMTNGIVHALLTLQMVPIVVSVKTGPAEELSKRLVNRIHDMVRESYLAPHASAQRPVLIICDRSEDIATGLVQPWTYHALLHDTLGMNLNKVELGGKVYELDEKDPLFAEIRGMDFGDASQRVSSAMEEYGQHKQRITGKRGDADAADDFQEDADRLSSAMSQAGQLAERKRNLDTHTALAVEMTKRIKERRLDAFAGLSEEIIRGDHYDEGVFNELRKGAGRVEDRVRFGCVHYLSKKPDDQAALQLAQESERLLLPDQAVPIPTAAGAAEAPPAQAAAPAHAFTYLRKMRGMQVPGGAAGGMGKDKGGMLGFAGSRKPLDFLAVGLKAASSAFKGGAQQTWLPHTRLVDAVLQAPSKQKGKEDRAKFLRQVNCVEPKTKQTIELTQFHFSTGICFVIGGGNYVEYENLKAWEKQEENAGKHVLYGASEMLSGEGLLRQLAELGKETKELG
eukprot:TRINITY_DN51940_c0_g1_i1.p1 TRINITY_DN51940_c0_g1~~TRINITY_DN51940_c0_g1_i1.p1  ORF type:complete len:684 (+),score=261.35 TRINITY_DN51940_c0_g1_i1:95-2053(+)